MLAAARRVRPNGRYVFVWINTQHHIRLYDQHPETDGSVARGRYVVAGHNQIYLSTIGYNSYRKVIGTPQVLELNVHIEGPGNGSHRADFRALAMQILSLTKLNWASTDSLCGEPITTKYVGDIAYLTAAFLRQGKNSSSTPHWSALHGSYNLCTVEARGSPLGLNQYLIQAPSTSSVKKRALEIAARFTARIMNGLS